MDELSQTLYEIAMSIGNHLDLTKMCDEVASVTMPKLNCSVFAVFCEKRVLNDKFVFENSYLTPESVNTAEYYEALLASLPQDIPRQQKNDFYKQLPMEFRQEDKGVWHLMFLFGYGLLAIFREEGPLPAELVSSLDEVNRKLAIACYACRAHVQSETSVRTQKLVLESMSEGVILINSLKNTLYVNDGFCQLLGKERGELISQPIEASLDHQNRALFRNAIEDCSGKGFMQCQIAWTKKNLLELETLTSVTPSIGDDGKLTGYIVVITDLTLQKQAEKQSALVTKMETIGSLAGGIAHDFNNMLAVIMGNVSYAMTKIESNDELFSLLSDVEKGTIKAQKLTHQLLTFSKGGQPVTETVDLHHVIRESVEFILRGANVHCDFDLQNDIPPVEVDSGQINQVIQNLVINAKQAMPTGGTIFINSETETLNTQNQLSLPEGTYVKIIIRDQGIGIPEKHLKKIFDPFFTTKQDGNGLGLATTFSIIQKHGGTITVDSKISQGTSFCIYLPESSEEILVSPEEIDHTHTGKGRILVMDDNEMMLELLGKMLGNMGYEPSLSTEGSSAIKTYQEAESEKKPFDLVILDLTVPGGMGGAEMMKELIKINPKVKALVASGYSNDPIMANYEKYGFSGVIPKPFSMDGLAKVLNSVR